VAQNGANLLLQTTRPDAWRARVPKRTLGTGPNGHGLQRSRLATNADAPNKHFGPVGPQTRKLVRQLNPAAIEVYSR
jgi:hypothetical protein